METLTRKRIPSGVRIASRDTGSDDAGSDDALPLEDLEERVVGEAGRLAAATCRWLLLLAEFDRRDGWSRSIGIRSTSHWLSWRCGIGAGTAAEHVRVARTLAGLPLVIEAFRAGRLSYSQVRALTRVADLVDEAALLEMAQHCTGAQLERLVSGLRRATTPPEERAAHRARRAAWYVDDDGTVVIRARLSGADGALLVAALDAAYGARLVEADDEGHDVGYGQAGPAEPGEEPGDPAGRGHEQLGATPPRTRADALVDLARGYAAWAASARRPGRAASAGSSASAGSPASAGSGPALPTPPPVPVRVVLHADLAALQEAAETRAATGGGAGPRPAGTREAGGARGAGPASPDRAEGGRPPRATRSSAERPAPSAPAGEEPPAPPAQGLSGGEGSSNRWALAATSSAAGLRKRSSAERLASSDHDPGADRASETGAAPATAVAPTPSTCRYEGAAGAHPTVLAQLLCDGSAYLVARLADGSGVDLGRSARRPGAALRAAVLRRDGGRCRYPGCGSRRHLHLHHVRHWIAGGPTDLENLVALCHFHHRRLHEEAYAIGTRPHGAFVFVLPDGQRVPEHPDVRPIRGAPALADDRTLSRADRLAREAAEFFVRGQRLRLHDAVDALLRAAAA